MKRLDVFPYIEWIFSTPITGYPVFVKIFIADSTVTMQLCFYNSNNRNFIFILNFLGV